MNGDKQPTRRNKTRTHRETRQSDQEQSKEHRYCVSLSLNIALRPGQEGPCLKPQQLRGPCSFSISPLCRARSPRCQGLYTPGTCAHQSLHAPSSHIGPQNSVADWPPMPLSGPLLWVSPSEYRPHCDGCTPTPRATTGTGTRGLEHPDTCT